ncbi:MAG: DNA mismatch repair protein MutS, partial [Proteobacteria bacterium]|nr:DNA mismatch repair protein MutS [Pseudomonadota bacterium]
MATSALDTPMMRQYVALKAEHPDAVLFYRMGDFYEMFLEDAEKVAPLLDLALTSRDKGKPDAVPMCGVPVHSADGYIKRLAELGHRVAICEQVEDPRTVSGRRLVRRQVVEVVTPGLVGDPEGIEATSEVGLVALDTRSEGVVGLAVLDASTGDFRATEVRAPEASALSARLFDELERIAPRELLLPHRGADALHEALRARLPDVALTAVSADHFDPGTAPIRPEGLEADAADPGSRAAAALLSYLGTHQPFILSAAPRLRRYQLGECMVLDAATRAHLELFENSEDRGRAGTLFERLDTTCTPLGARKLARWIAYPLLDPDAIAARQDAVEHLVGRDRPRARLRDALRPVRDLERLLAKALRPGSTPRDLGALRGSLEALPAVRESLLGEAASESLLPEERDAWPPALPLPEPVPELARALRDGLIDDPPVLARGSRGANLTGYIRAGFRPELDALRESAAKGREWIAGLELRERERAGIATLKVRFHPVHGYSLEVSKSQLGRVPEDYERKQTLANVERFTTPELRRMESQVMGEGERAAALEREILDLLREQVVAAADRVRSTAEAVATVDVQAALAEIARLEDWVRPRVDAATRIEIQAGRHPVVEGVLRSRGGDAFVPNDTRLDPDAEQIVLLTGPNMSGKST